MTKVSGAALRLRFLACAAAGVTALSLAPASAKAAAIYGSASIFTSRNCPSLNANDPCDISGVPRNFTQLSGGPGQAVSASASNSFGRWATTVSFGNLDSPYNYLLPKVGVSSDAGPFTRVGASTTAYRSYKNTSSFAISPTFTIDLNFDNSLDYNGEGEYREGHLNAVFAIVPLSHFADYQSRNANSIISNTANAFAQCGEFEVIAGADLNSVGTNGLGRRSASLGQTCSGARLTLAPGAEVVLVATLQAISNRGGFIHSMHTFTVDLDEANTVIAGTDTPVDVEVLRQAFTSVVPEPATWSLMIGGFGVAGAVLRRRRTASAA